MKTDGLTLYKKLVCSILLLVVVLAPPLSAGILTYEAASGGTSGFDVGVTDNPSNPSDYTNATEVWRKSGFIGRIRYTGPATTFTFTNSGPTVIGAPQNRFYFTCQSDPSSWSEFFLVVRLKATRHVDLVTDDFSGANVVVVQPGGTIQMPHGGGIEEVNKGEPGFDRYGNPGVYEGGLSVYRYKYPYASVWMDVTLIRTGNTSALMPYSIYKSNLTVTPDSATIPLTLYLTGSYTGPAIDDSAFLLYDPAEKGTLIGFDVGVTDSPPNPTAYGNPPEVWQKSGFIGRIVYTGPPTSFSFTNTGPNPNNPPTPTRFYFTRLSDQSSWKEFFLVIRPKGITHSGSRIDFSGTNTVVEHPTTGINDKIEIDDGAGFKEAVVGQDGYDRYGNKGKYEGGLSVYRYKYPYKYIWMDVTLIRTANSSSLVSGSFYESDITVASDSGASLALALSGKYGSPAGSPPIFSFGVTKTVNDPFPISSLIGRTTPALGLKVGMIDYSSGNTKADIHFAADSSGQSDEFYFTNEQNSNIKFRYYLAFQPTSPIGSLQQVEADSRFRTSVQVVHSPIDYPGRTYTWHHLKGDLLIYLPEQVKPASGIYKSIVYCFVTPVN